MYPIGRMPAVTIEKNSMIRILMESYDNIGKLLSGSFTSFPHHSNSSISLTVSQVFCQVFQAISPEYFFLS